MLDFVRHIITAEQFIALFLHTNFSVNILRPICWTIFSSTPVCSLIWNRKRIWKRLLHEAQREALSWSNWWDLSQNQLLQCEMLEDQFDEHSHVETFWKNFCLVQNIPLISTRAGYHLKCLNSPDPIPEVRYSAFYTTITFKFDKEIKFDIL